MIYLLIVALKFWIDCTAWLFISCNVRPVLLDLSVRDLNVSFMKLSNSVVNSPLLSNILPSSSSLLPAKALSIWLTVAFNGSNIVSCRVSPCSPCVFSISSRRDFCISVVFCCKNCFAFSVRPPVNPIKSSPPRLIASAMFFKSSSIPDIASINAVLNDPATSAKVVSISVANFTAPIPSVCASICFWVSSVICVNNCKKLPAISLVF